MMIGLCLLFAEFIILSPAMDESLTELFQSAANYVRSVAGRLKADDLLYLYARFKQANEGRCNTERPGFFDFQGKQKWDAWNALKSKSSTECMMEYIARLTDLDPCWEEKAKSSSHSKSGLGVCVSRMASEEEEIEDSQKTIFDWCRDGNIDVVEKMLTDSDVADINALDENGMSLLHWSCDRGHKEIVRLLLGRRADVNILDSESQTPLHYAISCDYPDIAQVLMCHGADVNMKDSEGNSPLDLAEPKSLLVT